MTASRTAKTRLEVLSPIETAERCFQPQTRLELTPASNEMAECCFQPQTRLGWRTAIEMAECCFQPQPQKEAPPSLKSNELAECSLQPQQTLVHASTKICKSLRTARIPKNWP